MMGLAMVQDVPVPIPHDTDMNKNIHDLKSACRVAFIIDQESHPIGSHHRRPAIAA